MEGFGFDNIMTADEAFAESLFTDDATESTVESQEETSQSSSTENDETTESIDVENLFGEDNGAESVGSGKKETEKESTVTKSDGTSTQNFYSSIATALKEDGILQFSDSDKIETASDFANAVEDYINSRIEEKNQRINKAINAGVDDSQIRNYETTINFLNGLSEDQIKAETEQGETLRKNLIYQDLINREYTDEEAREELQDILDAGTDIKRAMRALNSNKEFYNKGYQKLIDDNEAKVKAESERKQKEADEFKRSLLEDDKSFGFEVDKKTRAKAYDAATKAMYKDDKTGNFMTEIQKYENDNPVEFRKKLALVFTLTDGFKDFSALAKPIVQREKHKSISELERKINSTSRVSDGSMQFSSGVDDSPYSINGFGTKWDLNL